MPELGPFAQVAPYLTNPLVLAGFGLLLFFALLRVVLRSKVMPTVSQSAGGRALLSLLRYGFFVALVVIVLGFALAFYQTQRTTVDADQIIRDFTAAKQEAAAEKASHQATLDALARLSELQDSGAFRAAVLALVGQSKDPNAPRGIDRALEMLRQGETAAAETALAEILDRRLQERATASAEAAEAARNLGAIAYLNDTDKAIEAYEKAIELDPDDTWSWILLGRLYKRAGSLADAEQAFQKAREVAERAGSEHDVMIAIGNLGDVYADKGDLAGAMAAYEVGVAITKRLDAEESDHALWKRELSVSLNKIGDVRVAQGDRAGALEAYEESRAIRAELAARDPNNALWQRDLSFSYQRIGDIRRAAGDLAGAYNAYERSRAIRDQLAARDLGNLQLQFDLRLINERIGNLFMAQGTLANALALYESRHRTISALAARDPNNAEWQRDLSVSLAKIGQVRLDQGDRAGALQAFQDSHDIAEQLATRDPDNVLWQRDLSASSIALASYGSASAITRVRLPPSSRAARLLKSSPGGTPTTPRGSSSS